ncbi:protein AATF [Monomorium pharaonis]|uniref:protein AATF n=1 Tax=Monomorium pharaonis TaxID=307658 RepID=UPI00063FCAC8|nr:protein AATF [Monomorium pharaonis]
MAGKSLADKISALITTKPDFGSDEEPEDTKAKVEPYSESDISDDYLETAEIRRQNIDTLDQVDKRYSGKKILRKDIYIEDDNISKNGECIVSKDNAEDEEIGGLLNQRTNKLDHNENTNLKEESINNLESTYDWKEQDDCNMAELGTIQPCNMDVGDLFYKRKFSTIKTISETNVRTEIEKGISIRNQLKLWENFLEMRIKLQKCVAVSNKMPQYEMHKEFRSDVDFMKKVNETKMKLALVIENMLQLKDFLLKQYPETKNLRFDAKKRKTKERNINTNDSMDEEIPSDTENEFENEKQSSVDEDTKAIEESIPQKRLRYNDYEKIIRNDHDSYKEYRDFVIKKWNDKTRIVMGSLNKDSGQTTLKQIEFAMSDINKLRKRTQLKRSEYNIVGKALSNESNDGKRIQEYDPEIYDDDDFYHQLLRDLIEYKSSDVTDSIQLSKQWIQLQNLRKKIKRKIDTRATKGRKVRYNVHNKLVNFMAPITVYNTWTDNAKNELYNSLFGKIKLTKE